jgi:hypothetical protein
MSGSCGPAVDPSTGSQYGRETKEAEQLEPGEPRRLLAEGSSAVPSSTKESSEERVRTDTSAAGPQATQEGLRESRLPDYRKENVAAAAKAQDDYDKAILSLSGGALGVSFAFIKDIVGPGPVVRQYFLFAAWVAWAVSASCTLLSFYTSDQALRKAIRQTDLKKIDREKPGGWIAALTAVLNAGAGLLFLLGVGLIVYFVAANMGKVGAQPPSGRDATLTKVFSVGPFAEADTVMNTNDWSSAEQAVAFALSHQPPGRVVDRILLLGGVDRRSISARATRRFPTNQELAAARGELVRSRLGATLGDSIPISVIPLGALELEAPGDNVALSRDRRVDIYFLGHQQPSK